MQVRNVADGKYCLDYVGELSVYACNAFKDQVKKIDACYSIKSIGGRVDKVSATKTVDSSSIPDQVKPKAVKIGIHSFPASLSTIKRTV